ncbi:b-glycanase [Caudoviricetes sp.]|nr:b-glycanase [Caudoviricetes sp.]
MAFTSYTDNKLIDHLLGSNTFTKPASKYVALYVGDPVGSGTEISTSGSAYARQSASFSISGGVATNSGNIEYATATAAWGTITHVAIFDASTSGNMLVSAELSSAKTIGTGDVLRIPTGQLSVTLT